MPSPSPPGEGGGGGVCPLERSFDTQLPAFFLPFLPLFLFPPFSYFLIFLSFFPPLFLFFFSPTVLRSPFDHHRGPHTRHGGVRQPWPVQPAPGCTGEGGTIFICRRMLIIWICTILPLESWLLLLWSSLPSPSRGPRGFATPVSPPSQPYGKLAFPPGPRRVGCNHLQSYKLPFAHGTRGHTTEAKVGGLVLICFPGFKSQKIRHR